MSFPLPGDAGVQMPAELDADVYGQPQHWHDQHLKLEGPIVGTLEEQFDERWRLPANVGVYDPKVSVINLYERFKGDGWVLFSNAKASPTGKAVIIPSLGPVTPPPPCGEAIVQMWRTIPVGANRGGSLFTRGEFTIMAGVANAVSKAEKWNGLDDNGRARVLVVDAWNHTRNVGIYVYAKVQTYDDCLLVCGSANLNRRSFSNDMELDIAVLHRPTVRWHLGRLVHMVTGSPLLTFGDTWATDLFGKVQNAATRTITPGLSLIPDPFWSAVPIAATPRGQAYNPDRTFPPENIVEPSSLPGKIETTKPSEVGYQAGGDATGRLDLMVELIERRTAGTTFPYRQ